VIENPRILPHFHLSIQSFSDSVLKRMKRNYSGERLGSVLTKLRQIETKIPMSL
jgi:threonylcarbamoyladenosine tRNA methylthiotransferase MtaB